MRETQRRQVSKLFRQGMIAAIGVILDEHQPQDDPHWMAGYRAGKMAVNKEERAYFIDLGLEPPCLIKPMS